MAKKKAAKKSGGGVSSGGGAKSPKKAGMPMATTLGELELSSPEKKHAQSLGVALRNLLKLPKAHKWVCYEFFYSNLDKPLFEGNKKHRLMSNCAELLTQDVL